MNSVNKEIAVIIPTFNRKAAVLSILRDLGNQVTNHILQVYLVVDGSTDGTIDEVRNTYKRTEIVETDGDFWYTKSINLGFDTASKKGYDFYLTLNDDCVLPNDYIEKLMNSYTNVQQGSIVGSICFSVEAPKKLVFAGVKNIIWWRYKEIPYYSKGVVVDEDTFKGTHPSASLPGRGILIPHNTLQKVGFFNDYFVQYYSDTEFILRAKSLDVEVYISWDAKVYTFLAETGKGSFYMDEGLLEFSKNFFNQYSRIYLPFISKVISMYGVKSLMPLTVLIKILGCYKNYFRKRG